MNSMPISISALTPGTAAPSQEPAQDEGNQDFARMLTPPPEPATASPATSPAATAAVTNQPEDAKAPPDYAAATGLQAGKSSQTGIRAGRNAAERGKSGQDTNASGNETWPPPGLAGLELSNTGAASITGTQAPPEKTGLATRPAAEMSDPGAGSIAPAIADGSALPLQPAPANSSLVTPAATDSVSPPLPSSALAAAGDSAMQINGATSMLAASELTTTEQDGSAATLDPTSSLATALNSANGDIQSEFAPLLMGKKAESAGLDATTSSPTLDIMSIEAGDALDNIASPLSNPGHAVIDTALANLMPLNHASNNAIFNGTPTPTPQFYQNDFGEAVGARLSWLADQKIGHAHIKIAPDELGLVEVHLHLDGNKVNASFTSAHAEVRQALEESLPRLRDMLGQQGFQLANADVGDQQQRNTGAHVQAHSLELAAGSDLDTGGISPLNLQQRGLLDAYA